MTEEMGLQMFPENRYWRRRRDVQRQSVPQSGSSDRKSSIADGWKTGAWDNKRWCRHRAETLTSLVSRWLMEFLSKVRRSCAELAINRSRVRLSPTALSSRASKLTHMSLHPQAVWFGTSERYRKVTMGLASRWPCVTHTLWFIPPAGWRTKDRKMNTHVRLWSYGLWNL